MGNNRCPLRIEDEDVLDEEEEDGVTGRGTTLITSSQDLFLRQSIMTAAGITDEDVAFDVVDKDDDDNNDEDEADAPDIH